MSTKTANLINDLSDKEALFPPGSGLRVGICGRRFLDDELHAYLTQLGSEVFEIAGGVCRLVSERLKQPEPPKLRCLSSLAEGSDRLLAEVALLQGFSLHAVLPFQVETFAEDFPETLAEFHDLLGRAGQHLLILDGDRQERRSDSYEAAARWVLAHSDVLVAAWDGRPAQNRGGTAHSVTLALRSGIPVLWLPLDLQTPPRLIRTLADLHAQHGVSAPSSTPPSWREDLTRWCEAALLPPPATKRTLPWVGRLAKRWARRAGRPPRSPIWNTQWQIERAVLRLSGHQEPPKKQENRSEAVNPLRQGWSTLRSTAHALATGYSKGYRATFALAVVCGGVALVSAFLALLYPAEKLAFTTLELLCLLLIWFLVDQAEAEDWHGRFVVARAVAERGRLPEFRSPLGLRSSSGMSRADQGVQVDPAQWIIASWERWLEFPRGTLSGERLRDLHQEMLHTLVDGQIRYLGKTSGFRHHIDHALEKWVLGLFAGTLALLTLKLVLILIHAPYAAISSLTLVVVVLPSLSAVMFGLRAYAEYGPLSRRYGRTRAGLVRISEDMRSLQLDHALASQELAYFAEQITEVMSSDLEQWSDLTSSKVLSKEA